MAEIRVERKSGNRVWLWILAAIVAIVIAVALLEWAGYIDLSALADATAVATGTEALAAMPADLPHMEV